MPEFTGTNGSVTFGSGYAANAKAWTISKSDDAQDGTTFGDSGVSTFTPSGKSVWSGTFSCWLDDTTSISGGDVGATAAAATFQCKASRTFSGNIIISNWEVGVNIGELIEVNFTFQGSGALAITWA